MRQTPAGLADLAARALTYLARDERTMADFLALTGLTVPSLRAAAGTAGFARGVLSYLMADEDLFVGFAAAERADPAALARVMHAAIGADEASSA